MEDVGQGVSDLGSGTDCQKRGATLAAAQHLSCTVPGLQQPSTSSATHPHPTPAPHTDSRHPSIHSPTHQPTLATTSARGRVHPNKKRLDQPPNSGYRGCSCTATASSPARVSEEEMLPMESRKYRECAEGGSTACTAGMEARPNSAGRVMRSKRDHSPTTLLPAWRCRQAEQREGEIGVQV